jgi:N-methylhydantoinase A/oxoprolinase/acetone carboxylase beta subunit
MAHKVRIGIDVGGTFTKAVAIDIDSMEIIGKSNTLTTHDAPEGVAKGVITVFKNILDEYHLHPDDVTFIAHSTTQATNALLEGDVYPVGVIGLGKGFLGRILSKHQTKVGNIELTSGRFLNTYHAFIDSSNLKIEKVKESISKLVANGAKVIVASEAFGVDTIENELFVTKVANEMGIPATPSHEISKLYGLTVRTRTAVINASILPKMLETANMIELSVRSAGIKAPIMVMRGDGGVMNLDEMRKRPILTTLSGPAASVAGALMYLKVSDGIFFEVGGTSTNIGVIKNGRPMTKYVEIGGHRTYLNSLDVRVLGVAGGSMVRVRERKIIDVGPRSAHIAGLSYSAFALPEDIVDPEVIFIRPKMNDPSDYVAIKTVSGKIYAITNTCAANAIGITKPGDYAYGNPEAAKKAISALAKYLNSSIERIAEEILTISSNKIIKQIYALIKEYNLEKDQVVLVGGGGGAAALVPFIAKKLGIPYKISENAEVISSIGVALALVRDSVERVVPNPTPEIIESIKREAYYSAIRSGAEPESVQVYIEVDAQRLRVKAIATGSVGLRTRESSKKVNVEEAMRIAAESMHASPDEVTLLESIDNLYVFSKKRQKSGADTPIRVVDSSGFIRLQRSKGEVVSCLSQNAISEVKRLWENNMAFLADAVIYPEIYLLAGGRVSDLSGMTTFEQVEAFIKSELTAIRPDEKIILIAVKRI